MPQYFAYIRVSTAKQGEKGVSLQEQKDAILRYAAQHQLEIIDWFEERMSAAKKGRPVFTQMLKEIQRGKAAGVIIHKIDRSARNLKDWSNLGDLIDKGVEIHFANESIDLRSRGGRLSADIQAVVASDYIRNLREETIKGFYGRLKQGLLPLPAPIGYINQGKGRPKTIDPINGPLVKKAFELYSTGQYSLDTLRKKMHTLGFSNRKGEPLSRNGISIMLHHPFYIGIIRLRKTRETFLGIHEPLVSKSVFDRVQAILAGKLVNFTKRNEFLFQKILRCKNCGYVMPGETQKGYVYYRCHRETCRGTCINEEAVNSYVLQVLQQLQPNAREQQYYRQELQKFSLDCETEYEQQKKGLELRIQQNKDRLHRLTDAFIDGGLENELFQDRKASLIMETKTLEEKRAQLETHKDDIPEKLQKFVELVSNLCLSYKQGNREEKREIVQSISSNFWVEGKIPIMMLNFPFTELQNQQPVKGSDPQRARSRTFHAWAQQIWPQLVAHYCGSPLETT